jgi:adenosylcobinamide-GDP ribazoletransferase
VVVLLGAACGTAFGPWGALQFAASAVAGLAAAELLLRRCRARFGGITGDVFGALCETAVIATLVVASLG